jgi:PhnB protein
MNISFKPDGYNSVSPYFVINGAQKLVDLLKELFNASEKRRYELPDGKIMHLELQIDDSIIMIGDASEKFPVYTHLMHVYVKNVDETFNKAIRLGCESINIPTEREGDPNKRGAFKDFAGNTWTVATQL